MSTRAESKSKIKIKKLWPVEYDAVKRQWCNPKKPSRADPNETVGQRLLHVLSKHGSKVAQINHDTGEQMTFHEQWRKTVRAAQNLQKRGIKAREVICFMASNSFDLAPVMFASFCLACPINPLHPNLSKNEIIGILSKTKPTVVFCDASVCNQMTEALNYLQFKPMLFTFDGHVAAYEPVENLFIETGEENDFVPSGYDVKKDVAAIFCSSGTTGPSKCISLPYSCGLLQPVSYEDSDYVQLGFDSIYWGVGVRWIIAGAESGRTRIVTLQPFSPEFLLKLIEQYNVNFLYISTHHLIASMKTDLIHEADTSSMLAITFYGSKLADNLIADARRHFPKAHLNSIYGLSETGIITIGFCDDDSAANIGELVNGMVVKIVDEIGNRNGPYMSGEICVLNKDNFLCYCDDPTLTARVLDDEGFFHTGDKGYFDEDGYLVFEDRIKNAMQVYYFELVMLPTDIENCLHKLPDIEEVCVVGVPILMGSVLPAAVVVLKPNANLNKSEVFNMVAENMPNRAKLRAGIYFVDSLPKNHNGKIIRTEVTDLATEWFEKAKEQDPDVQLYLSDIPEEFRKMI